jgi:hypothetical protein
VNRDRVFININLAIFEMVDVLLIDELKAMGCRIVVEIEQPDSG